MTAPSLSSLIGRVRELDAELEEGIHDRGLADDKINKLRFLAPELADAAERMQAEKDAVEELRGLIREDRESAMAGLCQPCGNEMAVAVFMRHEDQECPQCERRKSEARVAELEGQIADLKGSLLIARGIASRLATIGSCHHPDAGQSPYGHGSTHYCSTCQQFVRFNTNDLDEIASWAAPSRPDTEPAQ